MRVVVPYVLDELRAVAALCPGGGCNHAVIDPLIVPERMWVGDPTVGVFWAEDNLRMEALDDVVRIVDMVRVRVGTPEESQVRGGHPLG